MKVWLVGVDISGELVEEPQVYATEELAGQKAKEWQKEYPVTFNVYVKEREVLTTYETKETKGE